MNFKIKLVVSGLLLALTSTAQNPNFEWAKKIGGTDFDESTSVAVDASGNVYTTGYYRGTVDFDPSVSGTVNLTAGGVQAGYILKLDANGNFVWVKDITGSFLVGPQCIKLDASGNIYLAGNYNGTVDFDPGTATNNITSGTSEIFVLKLDASGNYVWAKSMDGATGNAAYSLGIDQQGNVYTTGSFQGTTDFNPGTGTANLVSSGTQDIFLSKLDANGNYVWAVKMGGTGNDYATSNVVDGLGNIYTTGLFNNTVDFDPSASTSNLTSTGANDAFVSKIDKDGLFVWAKKLGGTGNETGYSIALDASGNVYTTGSFASTGADFDPGVGTYTMTASSTGIYVSKLTNAGNFWWAKQIGNGGSGKSITFDVADNMYVTGEFLGTADFNTDAGIDNLTSVGNYDVFITKFDNSANYLWTKQIGGVDNETGLSIAVDNSYNVLTAGRFIGTPNFNIGATSYTLTAPGSGTYQGFVHKISLCFTPNAPTNTTPSANQMICSNTTAVLSATTTGTVNWYATPTSTTVLASGSNYTTTTLSAGTYTYYTESSACTISATRTAITLTVNSVPTITVNSGIICAGQSFTIIPNGAISYTYSGGSNIVSPTSDVSYTITGVSNEGCANTAISSVTVNAAPTITVNSGSICLGNSFTINPTGANSFTTTGGSFNVSPTSNTSYSVTGTSIDGCLSSNTAVSSVTVNALPTLSVTSTNSLMCTGESATLTVTGANTYTWNTTDNTNAISISPSITTTYTVNGFDANGCENISTITQSVSLCTGITSLQKENLISIFPNPSNGVFTISGIEANTSILVYNMVGKLILFTNSNESFKTIDLTECSNGIYLLKVKSNNKEVINKLIKQ